MSRDDFEYSPIKSVLNYIVEAHDGMKIWDGLFSSSYNKMIPGHYTDGTYQDDSWNSLDPWPFSSVYDYYRNSDKWHYERQVFPVH